MQRTHILLAAPLLALFVVAGCGDDDDGGTVSKTPPPPAIGVQIDRMGRAAINTALIGPFRDKGAGGPRGMLQDTYNAASDPSQWATFFAGEIASNLAVYDALDTDCGNQLLAGTSVTANRYATLAGVLADDRLYVNTASGTCGTYLAVEANATGLLPNDDCGGRTPLYDTVDVSYSVLAAGTFDGVTDGVPKDFDGTASTDQFPFYAAPLPSPPPPALGAQIDRMGRAAINTALIGPFRDKGGGGARGMVQDMYNQAADPAQWASVFSSEVADNLAIYDALDTTCGNQLLAGTSATADRYDTLAGVLADDQLYVNSASGTCATYLAVEANATGLLPNNDCGGRTPLYDTIDISYSVLAAGTFSGVTDGVPVDADGTASASRFPFYDAPLPLP